MREKVTVLVATELWVPAAAREAGLLFHLIHKLTMLTISHSQLFLLFLFFWSSSAWSVQHIWASLVCSLGHSLDGRSLWALIWTYQLRAHVLCARNWISWLSKEWQSQWYVYPYPARKLCSSHWQANLTLLMC